MNNQPLVSVIIPTFNRWPYVVDAIRSVKNQTYPHVECIVVDDASTDGTASKLTDHFPKSETLKIVSLEKNAGQGAARNHGAKIAKGKLICFLDSDDILTENSITSRGRIYQKIKNYDGISFGDNITAGNTEPHMPGKKTEGEKISIKEYACDRGWLHTNTFMMPRTSFLALKGFKENLRQKQDVEFFLRALCTYPATYCGSTCSRMRDVKDTRARNDYKKIINQGTQFIDAVKNNEELFEQLPDDVIEDIIRQGILTYLNALYKGRKPHQFREMVRRFHRAGNLPISGRLLKRYLLSYLHNS